MAKDPLARLRVPALALIVVLATAATGASAPQASQPVSWDMARERIAASAAQDAQIRTAVDTWRRLATADTYSFATYADFLIAYPGWPSEARMRGNAERLVNPDMDDPGKIISYFTRFAPTTAQGKAVYALALARMARQAEARTMARAAWAAGPMDPATESRLSAQFYSALTPDDHLKRADMALWRKRPDVAERSLSLVPVTRQSVIAARIAFQRKAPDASVRMSAADPIGSMDAGYLADKARWMIDNGNGFAVRQMLASRTPLIGSPGDVEKWYELLLGQARAAANDGQWSVAYAIASKVDDAFAPGTDVSLQSLGIRDDYTSLTWLAGTAALNNLARPADAQGMFARYAGGARSAQTSSKGFYWAGRAALASRQTEAANGYFAQAGAYADQYYGQLALERLGQPVTLATINARTVQPTPAQSAAFMAQPIVRAARYLAMNGPRNEQSLFVKAIADKALSDVDIALAGELSRTLGRPDLGVMAGRAIGRTGISATTDVSFPRMTVPSGEQSNWTMIHAITRQESQFDRSIVSHANAHGLMQLLPSTAQDTARKVGMSFTQSSLYEPTYNMQLGSAYFRQLMNRYGGSYPLAVAAYNGGMGNVNKWLTANGDPRTGGVDMVQWIENIPFSETRNYVQRVLENAVVYNLINPSQPVTSTTPLSRYLGKSRPG